MAAGFVWYSNFFFGKAWRDLMGFQNGAPSSKNMTGIFGANFAGSLVMAYILAHFLNFTQASTLAAAATTAFWLWLGFIATVMLSIYLYAGKPLRLYWIDAIYQLIGVVLMALVLVSWK